MVNRLDSMAADQQFGRGSDRETVRGWHANVGPPAPANLPGGGW